MAGQAGRLLGAIAYFNDGDQQDNANVLYFPETGHGIGGGFRYFWENRGGLEIFGFPITDEMEEDGRTVQYCERAVLEYHPENIGAMAGSAPSSWTRCLPESVRQDAA